MPILYLVRHPHTRVDPSQPASRWGLSDRGRAEVRTLVALPLWASVSHVYTSSQPKTTLVGTAVQQAHSIPFTVNNALDEAQRDGWLGTDAFEAAQRAFFVEPESTPVAGWESAHAAQTRFLAAMDGILRQHPPGESLAVVSHGTVLTLYAAHVRGVPPTFDDWQQIGFAAIMAVDRATLQPLTPFLPAPYDTLP